MRHPVLPLFPEKFFADTAHIHGEAAAHYLVLLAHAWTRGGSLPDDRDQLRLMARCHPRRWGHVWPQIAPFWFRGDDGRLHQKRLDQEWQRATSRHDQGSKNGNLEIPKRDSRKGIKSRKINGQQFYSARARDPTPTPTEILSASQRENLCAPASLSVRSHASPALRLVSSTEPARLPEEVPAAQAVSPAPELPELVAAYRPEDKLTPAERTRIADEIVAKLHAEIAHDRLTEPKAGTFAELERQAAERKLEHLSTPETIAVSPLLMARLMGKPPPGGAKPKKPAKPPPRARRKAAR